MLKIHGIARSRAFRCIWAAEEAGLPYEIVPVGFGAEHKPEVLKVNPNGKIPALQDGALTLFESLAINLHIADKAGAPLMPVGNDASRVLQWTLWAATEIEPVHQQWAYNTYILAAEKRDAAAARANAEALGQRLAVLEKHLAAGGPYLTGKHFTIADCNLAAVLYGSWMNGFDYAPYPKAKAWLDACLDRPAALKARKLREG
ncbi:glutathione S-transferase family protein [Falsiroseomonas sp. HW251]|uniref:glutathione S-transferase family protein n=1 Tax=Falsiroseomonas sp. HW251 TaxID=3390998 RepID=UPI003D31029D